MSEQKLGHPLLTMQIKYEPDIVTARQKTRRLSQLLGFDNQDQARLATAVSELARNAYQYARTGKIEFFFSEFEPQTFYVRVSDQGPGIENLSDVLSGFYVSKSGMGVGLLGSKKLMDSFEIESERGRGTVVVLGKERPRKSALVSKADLAKISNQLVLNPTENPFEEIQNQNRDLLSALEELRTSREELANLNRELAETNRGVVALYAELDEKATSLQKANEVKTSFLSNMTHEFRTPLSSVISLTRLLLDRVDGDLTAEQEKQVTYIRKSSESLLELVNDLLDLAKVEAGKVTIHPTEFTAEEILGGLRGMFRPVLGPQSEIEMKVEWSPDLQALMTDQGKISQVLRNLISNAIKFTEKGAITVAAKPYENDMVLFSVQDSGIGIKPEDQKRIFEDFSQIESKIQSKQKGTGLGLPLSRKLARLLGGDIWVESEVGQGSTFYALIPRVYNGASEGILIDPTSMQMKDHSQEESESVASEKFRVLVIDDDEPSRYVLKTMVSAEIDAVFAESSDGGQGLHQIAQWKPDLVFLDLTMPKMDGFELLKALRRDIQFQEIPVVVNTAKKLTDEEMAYLKKEATAVLSKERTNQNLAVRDLRRALVKAGFDYRNM